MGEFSHPAVPTMFSMVVTPMDDRGRIDEAGLRAHLRRMIDADVGVYLGSGGSGEGHALTIDELAQVYRIGVDECKGKVPVYCNPPESRSANEMLEKSRQAIDAGADLVQFYQLDAGHGRVPVVAEQEMYFRDLLEAIDEPVGISIHAAVGYLAPCSLVTKLCLDYPQIKLVNIPLPAYTPGCDADPAKVACDYAETELKKVASKAYMDAGGSGASLLENFSWTNDDQNLVAKYITADGMSPEDAAAKWIADNPDKVAAWIS